MTLPRAVVIGYGNAGRYFHSYLVNLTPGLDLYGIASRNPNSRSQIVEELGCKVYDNYDSVFDDPEVDLVVLATPNSTHAELAIAALDGGKHVVTDKLMCLNLKECDRMIAAAEGSGKTLSVFQNRRWDGDFLTVKKLMAEGKLGDVRWLEMAWQRFGPPEGWRGQEAMGGGSFLDRGVHLFDQLLILLPQPITSVYFRRHNDFPDYDIDSHAMVVIGFEDGATALCDLSTTSAIEKPHFHLFGSKATFIKYGFDPQEDSMKAGDIDAALESEADYGRLNDGVEEIIVSTIAGRWRNYYENIADVLTNGAESEIKLSEARRVIALIDAALESARTNQVIQRKI